VFLRSLARGTVANSILLDVTKAPFNCVGDNSADDTVGLQSALDAAGVYTALGQYGIVYLPSGKKFKISKPLYVPGGVEVCGAGRYASTITWASDANGPTLIVGRDHTLPFWGSNAWTLVPSIVTGTTYSYKQKLSPKQFIDITQWINCRLGSQWTVKFVFRLDEQIPAGQSWYLTAVNGSLAAGTTATTDIYPRAGNGTCFAIKMDADGTGTQMNMNVLLRYNGLMPSNQVVLPGDVGLHNFTMGTTYEVKVSFNGTHLRVYIDGVLWSAGAKAVSTWGVGDGTGFVHNAWESWWLGSGTQLVFPSRDVQGRSVESTIAAFRLSNTAYTGANYTPTGAVEPTGINTPGYSDGTCQLALNWDEFYKDCVVGWSGLAGQRVYLRAEPAGYNESPDVMLRDFSMQYGAGCMFEWCSNLAVENVTHSDAYSGWEFHGNSYFAKARNVEVAGTARCAFMFSGGSSYIELTSCHSEAVVGYGFNACNVVMTNCSATIHPTGRIGWMSHYGGSYNLQSFQIDAEESCEPFVAGIIFEDPQQFVCTGTTLYTPPDCAAGRSLIYWCHGGDSPAAAVTFVNGLFEASGGAAEYIIKVVGDGGTTSVQPATFINICNPNAVPLSNATSAGVRKL
jgi:hypothetical protein